VNTLGEYTALVAAADTSVDETERSMELHDAIRRRRMVRSFDPRPIDAVTLDRILDAARRAPSAGNSQGVDLVVLDEPERYWSLTFPDADARAGFRWQRLFDAPVLVIAVVDPGAYTRRYSVSDKAATGLGDVDAWSVPYWWVDGGMAVQNLLLAAVDAGLGALLFGIFEHEAAVKTVFGIPEDRRIAGVIALGHLGPGADEAGASARRPRRTLEQMVHRGAWAPKRAI
jgi:nitroreductase